MGKQPIKTRSEFCRQFSGVYNWLLKNNPELLDKYLPSQQDTNPKKQQLLEMAEKGEERPSQTSKDLEVKQLGKALSHYTSPKTSTYDPDFTKTIKKLRPDWFENTAALKKQQLLEMAEKGEERPSQQSKDLEIKRLGRALSNYTVPKKDAYDPEFTKTIKRLRPDWFENTADLKKQQLLTMARKGEERPSRYSKDLDIKQLGMALTSYTNPKKGTYDPEFTKTIKKLRPNWFEDASALKKQQLLEMAKKGEGRPSQISKDLEIKRLGSALSNYTNPKTRSYDPDFTKTIKRLRPNWFK